MLRLTLDFRRRAGFLTRVLPPGPGRWQMDGESLPAETVAARLDGLHGVLLVCGYNSSEEGAGQAYATILSGLEAAGVQYDFAVEIHWPTGTGPGYHLAEARIRHDSRIFGDGVGNRFRDQLKALPFGSVDLIGHSAGCCIILDALRDGDVRGVRNLFLPAPAVSETAVSIGGTFVRGVHEISGRCVVFSSMRDSVLEKMYKIAKSPLVWLGIKPKEHARALGLYGPKPPTPSKVLHIDGTPWADGHSAHRKAPQYYEAIRAVAG